MRPLAAAVVAAAAALAPAAADSQPAARVYRVGVLAPSFSGFNFSLGMISDPLPWLAELGYVNGGNLHYETRSAAGDDRRLPALARELVERRVDVIVTSGTIAIRAAIGATRTIPIVMVSDADPVKAGFVVSLGRPGGNVTGLTLLAPELSAKRLELLKETVPATERVAVLWDPSDPDKAEEWARLDSAARTLGVRLTALEVRTPGELEAAFANARCEQADGLLVLESWLTRTQEKTIGSLATRHRLPAIYPSRAFVDAVGYGRGLMSYAPDHLGISRRLVSYVDRILKGVSPATLPVEQPPEFELVVNLAAARAIGLVIPPAVLLRATKVIE